jgi:L-asparaginase/Glu-tRNA(Gln) amidotransferase subunit D
MFPRLRACFVPAGYTSGQVGVEQLIAAVPQAKKLATLRGEQISNIDDDKLGFVASLDKNPQKARVLLRLALLKSSSAADVQQKFRDY